MTWTELMDAIRATAMAIWNQGYVFAPDDYEPLKKLLAELHGLAEDAENRIALTECRVAEHNYPPDDGFTAEVAAQRAEAEAEYARKRERQEGHRYGLLGANSFRWPDDDD